MKPYFVKHCLPSCGEQCEANASAIREDLQTFLCIVPYSWLSWTTYVFNTGIWQQVSGPTAGTYCK